MSRKNNKKNSALLAQNARTALGVLAIAVGCFRFYKISYWLFQQRWPLDYDGFYYLTELKHRLETGSGYYTSVHPFFETVTWVLRAGGWSPAQAYPWLVWIAFVLFGVGLLLPSIRKNFVVFSFLFLLFFGSRFGFFGFYGFLKQGWGMAMLSLGGVFAVPALLFHPSSALCAVISFFRERKVNYPVLAFLSAAGVILSWGLFRSVAFLNPFVSFAGLMSPFEVFELFFFVFLAVRFLAFLRKKNDRWMAFFGLLGVMGFLPFWGAEAWRMLITAFLISLMFFRFFLEKYAVPLENFISKALLVLLLATFVLPVEPHPLGPTLKVEPIEAMASELRAWIPPNAFIIAPHGLQFRLAYFLERSSAQALPSRFDARGAPLFELHRVEKSRNCFYPQCVALSTHWEIRKIQGRAGRIE